MQAINIQSTKREELVDISSQVKELIRDNQWQNGLLLIYCTHTTAGVTINESADPSVARDILAFLGRAVPQNGDYKHMEGNSDAHIKSSLIGCSQQLIVNDGKPVLGTWQGIFFAEFDGPRKRRVLVKWIGE